MEIFETISETRNAVKKWKKDGLSVGLVPTMGYLHDGHSSLIKESIKNNDKTIVSIFLNPTQFGPLEDLSSYPRDFERDKSLLEAIGADAVFHPSAEEVYRGHPLTKVYVEEMSCVLCGKTRPVHFGGVALVVSKLFNIITPDRTYFGLKDYQQFRIIKKMVCDLNFDVEVIGMPIIRDKDGLALSSRNVYLKTEEREAALSLNKSLDLAEKMAESGETSAAKIISAVRSMINAHACAKIDYASIVDPESLAEIDTLTYPAALLLAVYIGRARLIDNRIIGIKK